MFVFPEFTKKHLYKHYIGEYIFMCVRMHNVFTSLVYTVFLIF